MMQLAVRYQLFHFANDQVVCMFSVNPIATFIRDSLSFARIQIYSRFK